MVIDTSAIVAILFGEPETRGFAHAIDQDPLRLMSAVSVLEATMVVESELGEAGGRELDLLLRRAGIEVVGFLPEQLDAARHAFREPLLFKGNDFARTDVEGCS